MQDALFEVEFRPEGRYYGQILDALHRSGFGGDAAEAERVVSTLCGAVWAAQEVPRDGSTEEDFGLGLVDQARRRHTPTAVALLRTLAFLAPIREVREAAAGSADAMVAAGLPEPSWGRLDAVTPGRCWSYEDVFGDQATVICEFGREPGPGADGAGYAGGAGYAEGFATHAVVVEVDHAMFSAATNVTLADAVDVMVRDLQNAAKTSGQLFTLRLVDPPWARALLARAFARTDLIDGVPVGPAFAGLRALALARVRELPDAPEALPPEPRPPTPEECRSLVEEFMTGPEGGALADPERGASVAGLIVDYASAHDAGDIARVSPAKWDIFLCEWLPRRGLSDQVRAAVPDVVRAWSTWAARRGQLPELARVELARALDETLEASDGTLAA